MKNFIKYGVLIFIIFLVPFLAHFFYSSNSVTSDSEITRLYMYGDLSGMNSKEDKRYLEVKYVSSDISFNSYATLKIQGASSSYAYVKKGYNIVFFDDSDYSIKNNVDIGFGKHNKYTLKAEWTDKSHSRNVVSGKIAGDIQNEYGLFTDTVNNGVVDGFPIELYLNDEFYGLYSLTVPKDWMHNLDESNKNNLAIMAKDYDNKTTFSQLATEKWESFEVEVGEENDYSLALFNRLVRFIKNSSVADFRNNFSNYLDLDAMLNYYCFMMYAELYDDVNKNYMFVTYDGNYWYISLYDMDVSYGTSWSGNELLDYTDMFETYIADSQLWSKFEKAFPNEIAKRYEELRSTYLNKKYVMKQFNSYYNSIPKSSFELEDEKWGIKNGYGLDQISEFLDARTPVLDSYIENLKTDEYDELFGDKTEVPDVPEDTNTQGNVNQNQSSNNDSDNIVSKPPDIDSPTIENGESQNMVEDNTNVEVPSEDEEIAIDKEFNEDVVTEEKEIVESSKNNNYVLIVCLVIFVIIISVVLISLIILKRKDK